MEYPWEIDWMGWRKGCELPWHGNRDGRWDGSRVGKKGEMGVAMQ